MAKKRKFRGMTKAAAIATLRGIIDQKEKELCSIWIGDESAIYVEIDALKYAIEKIKQREDDKIVLEWHVRKDENGEWI